MWANVWMKTKREYCGFFKVIFMITDKNMRIVYNVSIEIEEWWYKKNHRICKQYVC